MPKLYKNVNIVLDAEIHRQAKSLAALEGQTLLAWVQLALADHVARAQQGQDAVAVAQ